MSLPLYDPSPFPEDPDLTPPDWSGPFGHPNRNNCLPVAPPSDISFLTTVTNYVTNPSAEAGLTGWTAFGSNQLSIGPPLSAFGSQCVGLSTLSTTEQRLVSIAVPPAAYPGPSQYVWMSIYVLPSVWNGGDLMISDEGTLAGGTLVYRNKVLVGTTGAWQRLVALYKNGSVNGQAFSFVVRTSKPTGAVNSIYFDAAQICVGTSTPIAYFDGDQPDSFWNGTPHASSSYKSLHLFNNRPLVSWYVRDPSLDFTGFVS